MHVQFTKAVEAKQVAEQEAERMKFVVLRADQVRYVTSQTSHHIPHAGKDRRCDAGRGRE